MTYASRVEATWRHGPRHFESVGALHRELVRYATLAASSHNTQCWRFEADDAAITIRPDFTRRCPVVDPDDHHLYASLGCAAENLLLAAAAHGLAAEIDDTVPAVKGMRIALSPGRPQTSALFDAIPQRQCTRNEYDGSALSNEALGSLQLAGSGAGVDVVLLTARDAMERVLDWVLQGNSAQLHNPAFVRELLQWVRFNDAHALATGDGLVGKVTGSPSIPAWLGRRAFPWLVRPGAENDKVARQLRSSAGIAVFVSAGDDPDHWLQAGRCYQRFALQATALGIRTAFLNQPVEEARLRPAFAQAFGIERGRPDFIVRFGRGPLMPRSLRRPLDEVYPAAT
jgi:hypothetical protein